MTNKKILVTGASGYIGKHVIDRLAMLNKDVISVDVSDEMINPHSKKLKMDILNGDKDIFQRLGCPDVCLHLAWRDSFLHNSSTHLAAIIQHYEFIENMIKGGLKHIAVLGTKHEIGYHIGAVDENTPCNPANRYGIAKNSLRQAVQLLANENNVKFQWLRAFYITGDDKRNRSIFTKIIEAEEKGQQTFPFSNCNNRYDFIDVKDLAKMITAAILQDEITGIINVCSGKPVSLVEQVESFIKQHHYKITLDYGAYPARPYDSPEIWGDITKITQILAKTSH